MMLAMFRKNKVLVVVCAALVLLSGVLLRDNPAFSTKAGIDRYILFNGQSWNMDTSFKQYWLTSEDTISFTVDLEDDYENKFANPPEGEETQPVETPFTVTASHNGEAVAVSEPVKADNFKGKYNVNIPFTKEGTLDIHIEIPENNSWDADAASANFQVERDSEAPKITLPENLDETLSTKAVTVNMMIEDAHFDPQNVQLSATRYGSSIPVSTKWTRKGSAYHGSVTFEEDGEYSLTLSAIDTAGNKSEEKSLSFSIRTKGPELQVTHNDAPVETGGFYAIDSIGLSVGSKIRLSEAEAKITRNGAVETKALTLSPNGREAKLDGGYHFTEDGTYEIAVSVTERHALGQKHDLAPVVLHIDRKNPEFKVEGAADKENYDEKKEVAITALDENFASGSVTVTRTGFNGVEKEDSYKLDGSGKAAFKADTDGLYEVTAQGADKAGNKAEHSFSFTVDTGEPAVWLSDENIDGKYLNKDKDLTIFVQDFTLKSKPVLKVKKDGKEHLTTQLDRSFFSYSKTLSFEDDGVYELELSTVDYFNREYTLGPISFTMDQTPPNLSVTGVKDGELYGEAKKAEIKGEDKNLVLEETLLKVTRNGKKHLEAAGEDALQTHEFKEDGEYVLTLESTDKAGNKTAIGPISFGIDQTPPELAITGVDIGEHYQKREAVLTVVDQRVDLKQTKVEVMKDDKPLDLGKLKWDTRKLENGLWKAELVLGFEEEGDYELTLHAADEKENAAESMKRNFTIDHTAPKISLDGIDAGAFIQEGKTLSITVDEHNFKHNKVSISAVKNGEKYDLGKWENTGEISKLNHTFKSDGDYEITVSAEDKAGNKAESRSLKFTVDNVKPVIEISGAQNASYWKSSRKVSISVTEHNFKNNAVDISVTRKANGEKKAYDIGSWSNTGKLSSISHEFNTDGEYEITVTSVDAAGNKADSKKLLFTIDQVAPELGISGVEDGEDYRTNKTVTFRASDINLDLGNVNLNVSRNGQAYHVGNFRLTSASAAELVFTFKEEGSYVLNLRAADKAGNETVHKRIAFIVDKTTPVVAISGVEDGSFNPAARNVTVSVDELNFSTNNVSIAATKDGRNFNIGSWKNTGKVSKLGYNFNRDGLYTLSVTATDKAGNGPAVEKKTFTIDTVKPAIEITGVENNAHYNVNKTVGVAITDLNLDVNKISVTRNGAAYNPGGFRVSGNVASLSHAYSAEGEYRIAVEATDKAGNSHSANMTFTIDKTAPVITPKFKGQNRVIKNGEFINEVFTPEFALDRSDDSIVSVTLNGGGNLGANVPVASREMKYTYKVLARDKAGNESTQEISFTLDTTKPALNITGVLDGFFNGTIAPRVTYSDLHLDSSKTSVTLNGAPFVNGTRLEREQDYVLKAVVTDLANNVSSRTIVFTIDKTAPVIKFKEPISNLYFNEDLIPELLIEDLNAYDIIAMLLNGEPYELGDPITDEGKHVLFFEVKDKAGNIQQLSVEFILDKTAPKVIFDGVQENRQYRDPVSLLIYLDNPEDKIKNVMINGEMFDGDVVEEDGRVVIKTTLTDVKKYEVAVTAYDEAGNETVSTVPFEIIEKGALVKLYENKPLFTGTIAGLVGTLVAASLLLWRRRKTAVVEEE
jgi:large repetitive protein